MNFVINCVYSASENYTFVIAYDNVLRCYTNFCLKGKVSSKEAGKFLKEQRRRDARNNKFL